MPVFEYSALDNSGKKVRSSLQAADRRAAQRKIAARQLRPIQIQEQGAHTAPAKKKHTRPAQSVSEVHEPAGHTTSRSFNFSLPKRKKRGSTKLGLEFLKRLLELHSSGMPVGDSVRLLQQRLSDPTLKEVAQTLWRELSEGRTLADAMAEQPELFPQSVVRVIEAGEATGRLAPIIESVVAHLEEREEIKNKVLGGLAYPVFIACAAVGVAIFLIVFLLPKMQSMLDQLGSDPNIFMRILLGSSSFATTVGPFLAVGIVIGAVTLSQWRRTATGKRLSDQFLLRVPFVGTIISCGEYFQLSNLLKTLIESGINMTETMRLSARTLDNAALSGRFRQTRIDVNEGANFSQSLRQNGLFNDLSVDILSIGENTGNLAHGLGEVAKGYRRELDRTLKIMTNLITSAAMAFGFTLVALVAVGMVTSILQVSSSISLSG